MTQANKAALKLRIHTYYYLCWVAMGMADDYDEWSVYMAACDEMENLCGFAYLGDILNLCED